MVCEFSAQRVGHAKLFTNAYRSWILDFAMSRNRTRTLRGGIEVDAVAAALAYEDATVFFKVPN